MANFRIREAKREDCAEILGLIKELAEYEKMPDSVQMTVEVLQRDGFGEKPLYSSLVAEELDKDGATIPGKLLAYALYYDIYSTWEGRCIYLEDLCVTPDHRNKGIGSALFKRVAQICVEEGCKRLQWAVLAWNSEAIKFYKKFGGINMTDKEEWNVYRIEREAMNKIVQ
ncbi:hypothetical protein LOTGIDRAFT_109229 [Lottia gigantea]|uniref:N-acetyltransferase domain-containing protein n=1 Tax=Lottia gigantea TaxID=225164 RepID=V4BGM4_LOTGI|nr:hypothetical protein LOTGIDRAFT_109229 [Lottia gigantea]ESP05012.1 hypothetical protein LOTGIDRAFT_109229 [Lottia gigantea]